MWHFQHNFLNCGRLSAVLFVLACVCISPIAHARIGENYRQCVLRYGNSVTNIPGFGHLLGVSVFEKSGIGVTIAFDRPNRQGFLVIYGTTDGGELKDNEMASLMASVNVSWVAIDDTADCGYGRNIVRNVFRGTIKKNISESDTVLSPTSKPDKASKLPKMPTWQENLDAAKAAVVDFIKALNRISTIVPSNNISQPLVTEKPHPLNWLSSITSLEPCYRSGDHLFVFRITGMGKCHGLAIINSDVSKAVLAWTTAFQDSLEPPKDLGRTLDGF